MLNQESFEKSLENLLGNFEEKTFLLATSGGVDSMVLASFFVFCNLKFEIAHINYKLRGEDSDLDEKLVHDFCIKNKTKFHAYQVSEKNKKPKNSIQNWARNLRYDFFKKIQKKENLEFLVTAHHLNDQLETFIINLSKASGINGLTGIPAKENKILRPLLNFTKEEIYDFAKENKIEFREDKSNQKNEYLRNKIRNEISPKLFETNEHFLLNFGKSLSYLNKTKNFVEEKIAEIENKILFKNENKIILNKEKISEQPDFVQFEILRKFGFESENEITKIFEAEKGKVFKSKTHQLIVDNNELVLFEKSEVGSRKSEDEIVLELNNENEIILPQTTHYELPTSQNVNWNFDAEKLKFPLKLRKKQEKDVFFPAGMIGKKKVSKYMKDEKISILAKEKIWILCDANNDVLGIIPFRQDRRFSANHETKNIIQIKY